MAAAAAAFMRMGSGNLEEAAGVVRLAAAEVVGIEVLPPILSEFRYQYPEHGNRAVGVQSNGGPVAARRGYRRAHGATEAKGFVGEARRPVALGFHAHRRYLERYGYPERLEDLVHHTLIGFDRVPPCGGFPRGAPHAGDARSCSHSDATTTWRYWPRCVPALASASASRNCSSRSRPIAAPRQAIQGRDGNLDRHAQ